MRFPSLVDLLRPLLAAALGWAALGSACAQGQAVHSRLSVAATVLAIVDYTRWPETGRPALVCTSAGGSHGQALFDALPSHPLGRRLAIRAVELNQPLPAACDVMLFEGWEAAAQAQQLLALAERAVLSLGLGSEFCSNGGAVCLMGSEGEISFEINTDALARAGLRVNPRVLQLSRNRSRLV